MKKSKAPTKKQIAWVTKTLQTWREHLLLGEWYLHTAYMSDDIEDEHFLTNATINADPVYLRAKIRIYPAFWKQDKDRRTRTLVHELCHCLTQETWNTTHHISNGNLVNDNTIRDQFERLTQRITNAIYLSRS